MEAGLREVCRSVRIGKILIQRARYLSLFKHIPIWEEYWSRMKRPRNQNCSTPNFLQTSLGDMSSFWTRCLVRLASLVPLSVTWLISTILLIATGGSAIKAVEVLIEHGVPAERIIFINLVRPTPFHQFLPFIDFDLQHESLLCSSRDQSLLS